MIAQGVLITVGVSDHRYDFRGKGQIHIYFKSVLWLVLRTPLLFLTEGAHMIVHISSNECFCRVDNIKGCSYVSQ